MAKQDEPLHRTSFIPKIGDVVVWGDNKPGVIKAMGPSRVCMGLVYFLESGEVKQETFVYCRYLRPATPAECRAAGLDPAVVGPVNGEAPVKFPRPSWSATGPLESPTPSAREVALEAQVAALTKERDQARNDSRVNAEAWGRKCDEVLAMKAECYAAIRDAAKQRERAEAAERDRDSWRSEAMRLKAALPTPAPATTPTLTPEDRAWMDAMQHGQVRERYSCEWPEVQAAAKAAIAARAKGV